MKEAYRIYTLAEALAAKVPVLTSDLDGPMEIICNGKYGYFFRLLVEYDYNNTHFK